MKILFPIWRWLSQRVNGSEKHFFSTATGSVLRVYHVCRSGFLQMECILDVLPHQNVVVSTRRLLFKFWQPWSLTAATAAMLYLWDNTVVGLKWGTIWPGLDEDAPEISSGFLSLATTIAYWWGWLLSWPSFRRRGLTKDGGGGARPSKWPRWSGPRKYKRISD